MSCEAYRGRLCFRLPSLTVSAGSDEQEQVLIGHDRDILQAHKSGFKKE